MNKYPINKERISLLSIQEQAKRRILPDALSIKSIGELMLDDKQERYSFYTNLIKACKDKKVEHTGNIDSWEVDYDSWCVKYGLLEYPDKPYRDLNLSEKETRHKIYQEAYWETAEKDYFEVVSPPNCLIKRDDLKTFLQSGQYWPVEGCLLANWWRDETLTKRQKVIAPDDPRLKYADKFGEKISLPELCQRWQANIKLINELALAKKITPYFEERIATVRRIKDSTLFVFLKQAKRDQPMVIEDELDTPKYKQLPDNAYFYWIDVLSFEDKNPEIKNRIKTEDALLTQNSEKLTIEQQARQKSLPNILSLIHIVRLWTPDKKGQESIRKAMLEDYEKGILVAENSEQNSGNNSLKFHRDSFKTWLSRLHKKPINDCFHNGCLLANWWTDEVIELSKTKRPLNTIHENNTFPFYEAYRELEKRLANLTYIEFGLFVFYGDIRIFEKSPDDDGNLKQLAGCGELNEVGIADTISGETTSLPLTLSRFCYAKEDIDRLTPSYRYICFDDACKEIAYFSNKPEEEIKEFLIQKAEVEKIYPYHPYCCFVHPEQEKFLPSSAFPDYQIAQILRDDFGISEYDCALDIEVYIDKLQEKGNSDDEINRIRKILGRRVEASATLIEKRNAIAELAALRPPSYDKYAKPTCDLIKKLMPLNISPCHEDRVIRFVWLGILNKRKEKIDKESSSDARTQELDDLNHTITDIKVQLGCSDNTLQDQLTETKNINDKKMLDGKSKTRNQLDKVNDKFSSFNNLRANQISLVMMDGGKAKMVINGKNINIFPEDFKLKEKSQGWKLLEGAAMYDGNLQVALKSLNKSNNRETEVNKIRTAINRLNEKLKISIGLQENPILFDSGCYRFIFKTMIHELTGGLNVTKSSDAMCHLSESEPDEDSSTQGFWNDSD